METGIINGAKYFAIKHHKLTNCTYAGEPYETHLQGVVDVATRFLYELPEGISHDEILAACWTHDLIEDAHLSYNDVRKKVGTIAANIVYDVTDELGKNRKERHCKTYLKTADSVSATFVKLCDRIFNTEFSKSNGNSQYSMYKKEYTFFRYIC